ncbi:MAG: MG2 domain-containing protein, partial [Anaerolineaceae bacterium]|nr:MG2 domain-containing protein [Anaerolineaceae bacterium]
MSRKALINLIAIFLVLALVGGVFAASRYYVNLPENLSQHETIVLGQNRFVPGSEAAMRVIVRDSKDGAPLEGAEIEIGMRPADGGKTIIVFSGETDSKGTTNVSFEVPDEVEPNQTLIIETKSSLGSDTVERPVTVDREYRVLLTTDKPIYQPGQIIHVRALALSDFDLIPAANQSLEIIIADGKGNKVFRDTLTTSDFGVAAVDFQLASEVSTGNYKITTELGNVSSEKTVVVEHYVLPKFDVKIETLETFYLPGERVEGTLRANYFYGKPVAGGEVLLEGYIFDVERVVTVSLQGITDEDGNFEFGFVLPEYIAGSDLEGGLGRFYLQASLTDLAQHTEIKNASLPVSGSALVIDAIPEGGQFRPGVENILYVLTSYPDGSPAETDLTLTFYIDESVIEAQTGGFGLAEIVYAPTEPWQNFRIDASDAMGNHATREFYFEGMWYDETVLLRPDKPVYRVGDTMNLTILTSQPAGTVYLDIVREGQTVSTRSIDVEAGQAVVPVDLSPDMYGTLELHA